MATAQTSGKVGVNTATPTETFNVKGTVRITELPINGASASIYTKTDGTASAAKDQTFNAVKTVAADNNGVIGVINASPVYSQTKCSYGNSPAGFSDNTDYARIDFPNYSFIWRMNNGSAAATGNETLAINNQPTTDYGITKNYGGDGSNIAGSFSPFAPGARVRITNSVNWDTEESGEYIFYTEKNLAYRIVYWSQKRTSESTPSFCWNITKLN